MMMLMRDLNHCFLSIIAVFLASVAVCSGAKCKDAQLEAITSKYYLCTAKKALSCEEAKSCAKRFQSSAFYCLVSDEFYDLMEQDLKSSCESVGRMIRSAKKGGGGGSRSRSSSSSSSRSGGTRRRISSAVNRGRKVVSGLLNRRKSGSSLPKTGSTAVGAAKKKKSFVRKYGKYAVAGLAAYGTYKLAKKMSKGLKKAYDDDDCWEYNPFQEAYSCQCEEQCNYYAGGAAILGPMNFGLTVFVAVVLATFLR